MAYIDPDGMFYGDRMALISDEARLCWPYFWVASNTVGRLELNYQKVIGRAFHHFKKPPSEDQFWLWLREYRDAYLLYIYKHNGQVWGQWDVSERYLPNHKTAPDKRTPAPDGKAFSDWKDRYVSSKKAIIDNPSNINDFKRLEKSPVERRGSGSGNGSGEEKETLKSSSSVTEISKNLTPPKNDDDKPKTPKPAFASIADELVALILKATGESPDRKLIESIRQSVESRSGTLRAFLDDIEPRLGRLKEKPGQGFFHDHAKKFGGYEQQPIIANEIRGPCCKYGVTADGKCCTSCQTGRDLQLAQKAIEREKGPVETST